MSVSSFCRFWHLQDILKMLCRKTLSLFWTTYSGMVLLWEVYWKYFWKFCLLLRHSSSPEKNRWRVPTGHFPVAFLVVGTFILTQKEVILLANVRDSEHLQKGNLPIGKSRLSGLSVRIKQCSVWRWETGGERSRRKRRRRKWEAEQRDGHFISTAKDLQAGNCDPKVQIRTVGSQERRARTLSSLSQSPLTLFDSSFWKYF